MYCAAQATALSDRHPSARGGGSAVTPRGKRAQQPPERRTGALGAGLRALRVQGLGPSGCRALKVQVQDLGQAKEAAFMLSIALAPSLTRPRNLSHARTRLAPALTYAPHPSHTGALATAGNARALQQHLLGGLCGAGQVSNKHASLWGVCVCGGGGGCKPEPSTRCHLSHPVMQPPKAHTTLKHMPKAVICTFPHPTLQPSNNSAAGLSPAAGTMPACGRSWRQQGQQRRG